MSPFGRIFVASVGFAATLSATLLALTLAYADWLEAHPVDPPDNAPIRAAGLILVVGAPAAFVVALLLAIPISFRLLRPAGPAIPDVAKLVGATAITAGAVLGFPASAFAPVFSLAYVAAAIAIALVACVVVAPASICWWFLVRRPLTIGLERP